MKLFGLIHLSLLLATALIAIVLCFLCRSGRLSKRTLRFFFGFGLALNEFVWWHFVYSQEGLRITNLPLQLCDISLWATIAACLFLNPLLVEFAYFAGLAGAGIALVTPDLWTPWPSYPAVYFFVVHSGIVIANIVLIYGGIAVIRKGGVWRAFGLLLTCAAFLGVFNKVFKTNYMYLCNKPKNATVLDLLGPWPLYLLAGLGLALVLYLLLWLPVRNREAHQLNDPADARNAV